VWEFGEKNLVTGIDRYGIVSLCDSWKIPFAFIRKTRIFRNLSEAN